MAPIPEVLPFTQARRRGVSATTPLESAGALLAYPVVGALAARRARSQRRSVRCLVKLLEQERFREIETPPEPDARCGLQIGKLLEGLDAFSDDPSCRANGRSLRSPSGRSESAKSCWPRPNGSSAGSSSRPGAGTDVSRAPPRSAWRSAPSSTSDQSLALPQNENFGLG